MRTGEGDPEPLKLPSGPVLSAEPRVLKRKHEADRHRHTAVETKRRRTRGRGEDGIRRWVFSPRDLSSSMQRFVIVSYNLLGVENASKHLDLYHSVPSHCLNWDRRKRQIHKELTLYNPNILCFQEVDKFDELASLFQTDGYAGIYKQRTGEANDGCAIFWKEKEFTLLYQEDIEFQKFGLRNNVAQLCLLKVSNNHSNHPVDKNTSSGTECKFATPVSSRTLVVGNIHVLFNPNRGDIKLGQMRVLLERANALSKKYGNAPVVISGDLNSTPKSAICQFLSSTEVLDILQYDRKKMSGQVEFSTRHVSFAVQNDRLRMWRCMTSQMKYSWSEEEICLASGRRGCTHLRNPLILSSAYQGVPGGYKTRDENGEPLATSYHSKFMGTVDYIWHSSSLVPVGVVDTLPIKILERLGGLPNKQWGSDHLSLVCEFAFVD
ncbi:carbon catabolite repressor protein 4 homolog 5-like isoform X1 [Zingiber officinale]|uniref:carbon catabolite repressor protein 4 homolog 5-like isoform X1 n=1 Tax=Zingiber officinale TaxID=94328 RepID=UPI001C4CAB7C|nr:carbon catabolite repressor protein 4 homolog 5-like isoform X1 [Zingiber officinale]